MHERLTDLNQDAYHVRCLPADIEEVVTLRMSWPVGLDHGSSEPLWTDLASMLLDKGTPGRTKSDLSALFDDRGADFNIATDGLYVRAGLRCLRRDLGMLFPVVMECLWESDFPNEEIQLAAGRLRTHLMRERSQTASQAGTALAGCLFPNTHPNHEPTVEIRLDILDALDISAFQSFATTRLRPARLNMAVVGDFQPEEMRALAEAHIQGRPVLEIRPRSFMQGVQTTGGTAHVAISDRKNLDLRVGHAIGMDRTHPEFDALSAAVFVFGGNFSSRLMSTVRDRDGLTYGVGAGLQGFDRSVSGAWITRISLSPENLDEGVKRTREEIERFVTGGISAEELDEVVQTMTGSWLVHVGTTGGMAARIRRHMELGFPASELDDWPTRLHNLKLAEVNRTIREWLHTDAMWTCSAGQRINDPA